MFLKLIKWIVILFAVGTLTYFTIDYVTLNGKGLQNPEIAFWMILSVAAVSTLWLILRSIPIFKRFF